MSDTTATRCFICGHANENILEVHHTVPQRLGGGDTPENTYSLCGSCHNAVEEMYDDGFYRRLGVAVDELEDDTFDARKLGEDVAAEESLDRKLDAASDHIRVEDCATGEPVDDMVETVSGESLAVRPEFPDIYRLHCGYCHRAFSQNQHADLARHLRIQHGIENPYERTDTTFGDVEARRRFLDEHFGGDR